MDWVCIYNRKTRNATELRCEISLKAATWKTEEEMGG
jgi:hypothetical protein